MKKIILAISILILGGTSVAFAAPQYQFSKSFLPETTDTYYLGSTSPNLEWNGGYFKNLRITGTCTGCGSSGVGTSTNPFMATYFVATSSSATSTIPRESSTGISTSWLCLTGDSCRTSWPTSLTPGGSNGSVQYNNGIGSLSGFGLYNGDLNIDATFRIVDNTTDLNPFFSVDFNGGTTIIGDQFCAVWCGGTATFDSSNDQFTSTFNQNTFNNLSVGGNTVLGATTVNATLNTQTLNPNFNNTYDLGGLGIAYRNLYLSGTANIPTLLLTGASDGCLRATNGTGQVQSFSTGSNCVVYSTSPVVNRYAFWGASGLTNGGIFTSGGQTMISTSTLDAGNSVFTIAGTTASNFQTLLIAQAGDTYPASGTTCALCFRMGTNQGLGISTSTQWGLLSVNPTAAQGTRPSFVVGSSTATNFIVDYIGRTGIGTSTPYSMLSVAGQVVAQNFVATSTSATSTFQDIRIGQNRVLGWDNGNSTASICLSTTTGYGLNIDDCTANVGASSETIPVGRIVTSLYISTASKVINTSAETTMFSTSALGTTTLPTNYSTIGKHFSLHFRGQYSTPIGNIETVTGKLKFAGTTVGTVTTASFPASASNQPFKVDADCTMNTIGTSGTITCDGELEYQTVVSGTNVWVTNDLSTIGPVTVNNAAKGSFDVTADWSQASFTTQSITITQAWIEQN